MLVLNQGSAAGVVFLTVLLLASWSDVRSRRIPNLVTVAGMLAGLAFHAARGILPLGASLLGLSLAFLVALPFFLNGALGGGDAKLLMVVGAFFGPLDFLYAGLAIALAGGALALCVAARQGALRPVLASCGRLVFWWVSTAGRHSGPGVSARPLAVPYGLAISIGSVAWWLIRIGGL